MSSLFIGLHLQSFQISATLIRVDPSPLDRSLTIERDTSFTRSVELLPSTDPREFIQTAIDCLDDLLQEFSTNIPDDLAIHGIAVTLPMLMLHDQAISIDCSTSWRKFFALNLRFAFQSALKVLVQRWKEKFHFNGQRSSSSRVKPSTKLWKNAFHHQPRSVIISPPTIPKDTLTFTIIPSTIKELVEGQFAKNLAKHFCGKHDDEEESIIKERTGSRISELTRENYFHDIEHYTKTRSSWKNGLSDRFWSILDQLPSLPISFHSEATSLGLGETLDDRQHRSKRILSLTLGHSLNSAFIDRNDIITDRLDVPPDGDLRTCPYDQNSTAEEFFSTQTLMDIYRKLSPDENSSISSYASLCRSVSQGDPIAVKTLQVFIRLLGQFLVPYINGFRTDLIIIGGDFAQFWYLVEEELIKTIRPFSSAQVYFSLSYVKSMCLGAVEQHFLQPNSRQACRQTNQYLLPVTKLIDDRSEYDLYPSHRIPIGQIGVGFRELNEKLVQFINHDQCLLIDGFVGTYFQEYANQLNEFYFQQMKEKNVSGILLFYDSRAILQTDDDLQRQLYLKDPKSIFGKVASDLDFQKDFLDPKKFECLKENLSSPCIIIGPASSCVNEKAPLIYIDLPKNELYYRVASQTSSSYLKPRRRLTIANEDQGLTAELYEQKSLYFLDYPIFNKLKQELISRWNIFVDGQRPQCPTWIDGETFRQALVHLSNEPIRLRPWFESSPWGGQWLKTLCQHLSKHAKNYAWCYDFVPGENGLILSDSNDHLLEFSWDLFYGSQSTRILGNDAHCRLFSNFNDFPLRLNLLDTMNGGNLALQCNPSLQYMRSHFGEKIPQDEAYYVVRTKSTWKEEFIPNPTTFSCIYLGFHPNIDREEFEETLRISEQTKQDFNVANYVQCVPTHDHDFFLIPPETIHALGRNQVVLEISAAPRIYSLKLYDWLRLGLDGRPRHLSIEHGLKNLNFDRRGEQLRCQPVRLKSESQHYEEHHLATHPLHFYDVHRLIIEPDSTIEVHRKTENRFQLCVLIEGDTIEIEYANIDHPEQKQIRQYNAFETFLVPASINEYLLRPGIKSENLEKKPENFILLIAFLKWDCEKYFQ